MTTAAGRAGLNMRFGIMAQDVSLSLLMRVVTADWQSDQEKGKIPGREGYLVCNSRICTHAQTGLCSILHMAEGDEFMQLCRRTQTHDCTQQQAFDRQQHAGGGQVKPLSNSQ